MSDDIGDVSNFSDPTSEATVPESLVEFIATMIGSMDMNHVATNFLQDDRITDQQFKDAIYNLSVNKDRLIHALLKSETLEAALELVLEDLYENLKDATLE